MGKGEQGGKKKKNNNNKKKEQRKKQKPEGKCHSLCRRKNGGNSGPSRPAPTCTRSSAMDRLAPLPSCRCRRRTSIRPILAAPPVISDIPALVIVYFILDVPSLKDGAVIREVVSCSPLISVESQERTRKKTRKFSTPSRRLFFSCSH